MPKIIYHGTTYDFDIPSLSKCKDRKDFGKGFYLAEDLSHAQGVAKKGYLSNTNSNFAYIYSYKIDIKEIRKSGLNVHEFIEPNYSWLEFVLKNRNLIEVENYDVIIGPTADARAQRDITEFYKRYGLSASNNVKDKLIKEIEPYVYGKQYCFRTQESINYLNSRFCERRTFK